MTDNPLQQYSIDVLNSFGNIELIDMMPHPSTGITPDAAIVQAARVSHAGVSKGDVADKKLLMRLMRDGHTSPFEQVEFKFRITAPLVTYWQWVRHREFKYLSINSQSGRYTAFDETAMLHVMNDEWRTQSSHNKQASSVPINREVGNNLTRRLEETIKAGFRDYEYALSQGVAKEQARFFLPGFLCLYTWYVKTDALNLMKFFKLRCAPDAQWEICAYALAMRNHIFTPLMSWTSEAYYEYMAPEQKGDMTPYAD